MNNIQKTPAPSTQEIARRGEAIYKQHQHELEQNAKGKFAAINVNTSEVTVSDSSQDAIEKASQKDPHGLFHLVRVGHQSAFEAGWYMTHAS